MKPEGNKITSIPPTNVSGWAHSFVKRLVQIFDSKYETRAERDSDGIHILCRERRKRRGSERNDP